MLDTYQKNSVKLSYNRHRRKYLSIYQYNNLSKMNKSLSPAISGIVGLVLLGLTFLFQGILSDLLKILSLILIVTSLIGIFRKGKKI